jgi:hypothetical protein
MRSGMKPKSAVAILSGTLAVAACAVAPPTSPTVTALPPRGKTLAAFQQEDAGCRGYASAAIAPSNAATSEYNLQTRYNVAYTQCMYSRGNSVQAPPPLYAGPEYPAYAGLYPYPSPWYGAGLYPWYGDGLFGSDIIVFGGSQHHFHHGFPEGFYGGGVATGGLGSWRSGGSQGGPATGGSRPWRR